MGKNNRCHNASQRGISYNILIRLGGDDRLLRVVLENQRLVVEKSAGCVLGNLFLDVVDLEVETGAHIIEERDELLLVVGTDKEDIL